MKRRFCFISLVLVIFPTAFLSCKTEIGPGDTAWNEAVDPSRATFDMGGYGLHYIDLGAGEPVVMVHGFADSTYSFHENVPALKEAGFRLIMIDQPGLGRSDTPPEPYVFSIENQARAVVRLTEHLGLYKFRIIGHSMGGGIALYIMVNHPGRVHQAVLIDPVCFGPPAVQLMKLPAMEFFATLFGGRWSVRMGLEDSYYDSDNVDSALVDECARFITRPGYYRTLISLEKQYYSPAFRKMSESYHTIHNPVLIIWGQEDTWLPVEQGRTLQSQMENAMLHVLEKCGHLPQQECRDEVNPLLIRFLNHS